MGEEVTSDFVRLQSTMGFFIGKGRNMLTIRLFLWYNKPKYRVYFFEIGIKYAQKMKIS